LFKKLGILVLAVAALSSIAATCVVQRVKITEIDNDETVYGAEMHNQTTADTLNHRFRVAFIGNNNQVLETVTVNGCLRSLQAGATNFFSALYDDDDAAVGLSRIEGPLTYGDLADGELQLGNIKVTRNGNNLVVTGTVLNNGDDDLEDVRVCIVARDEDDNVQRVQLDGDTPDLNDGQQFSFSVTVRVSDDEDDSTTVDVWVDGLNPDDDDKPIEPDSDLNNEIDECPNPTNTPTPGGPTSTPTNTPTNTSTPVNTATATPDDAC
jgi:hypothetical protein